MLLVSRPQGCSSHPSLPEGFVFAFAQTHHCHVSTFAALMLLLSRNFCVLVFPAGLEISSWQTLPVLGLGWLWLCNARLPKDSPHPKIPKLCRARIAGSCLSTGILMIDISCSSHSPASKNEWSLLSLSKRSPAWAVSELGEIHSQSCP